MKKYIFIDQETSRRVMIQEALSAETGVVYRNNFFKWKPGARPEAYAWDEDPIDNWNEQINIIEVFVPTDDIYLYLHASNALACWFVYDLCLINETYNIKKIYVYSGELTRAESFVDKCKDKFKEHFGDKKEFPDNILSKEDIFELAVVCSLDDVQKCISLNSKLTTVQKKQKEFREVFDLNKSLTAAYISGYDIDDSLKTVILERLAGETPIDWQDIPQIGRMLNDHLETMFTLGVEDGDLE